MGRSRNPVPSYLLNRATGRAYCNVDGRRIWLGRYGSEESKDHYRRVLEGVEQGRKMAAEQAKHPPAVSPSDRPKVVGEVAALFLASQVGGYHPSEAEHFRRAVGILVTLHAATPLAEFGPRALAEVRDQMVSSGWTRQHVNSQVGRVRAIFRWAESLELVPAGKWFQLRSLPGLKAGKTSAKDQQTIRPVDDATVEATLPHLSATVRAMVQFQRLTGCRPQDVCNIRPDLIDRTGEVWVFRPDKHKTAWRGMSREVYIGPRAQEVLTPFLGGDPTKPVFSPRRAWQEEIDRRRAAAKGKGHRASWERRGPPLRVREQYDVETYRRAVKRGCEKAGVKRWKPNQLRHAAGTAFRNEYGLEAAQKLLGHKHSKTTERYAKVLDVAAIAAARKSG